MLSTFMLSKALPSQTCRYRFQIQRSQWRCQQTCGFGKRATLESKIVPTPWAGGTLGRRPYRSFVFWPKCQMRVKNFLVHCHAPNSPIARHGGFPLCIFCTVDCADGVNVFGISTPCTLCTLCLTRISKFPTSVQNRRGLKSSVSLPRICFPPWAGGITPQVLFSRWRHTTLRGTNYEDAVTSN